MRMDAKAWRTHSDFGYIYKVQINDIEFKTRKVVDYIFKDWKQSGYGWNLISKNEVKLFTKQFKTEKEWIDWAKKCPIKLFEIKIRDGKEKLIQLSCKTRKKRGS